MRDLDDVLHVADVDAVAGDAVAVDLDTRDTACRRCGRRRCRSRPGTSLEELLDLQADAFDLPQVGAVDLDAHHRAEAGLEHDDARLDRLEPRRQHAGDRGLLLQLLRGFRPW